MNTNQLLWMCCTGRLFPTYRSGNSSSGSSSSSSEESGELIDPQPRQADGPAGRLSILEMFPDAPDVQPRLVINGATTAAKGL
jgi:hypothetical protein